VDDVSAPAATADDTALVLLMTAHGVVLADLQFGM